MRPGNIRRGDRVSPRKTASGFTLMEMVVATAVTSLLMAGMASAILITSLAMPTGTSGVSATNSAASALNLFAADLAAAKSIVSNTATSIQFTVADRGGVSGDETIAYRWSGVAGAALTRQINGGTATNVQNNVQEFNLDYFKKSVSTTENVTTVGFGPEQLLASWTAYPSGSPTTKDFSIAASGSAGSTIGWGGEFVKLGALPANFSKLTFTKVKLWMKTINGSTQDPMVSIHPATGGGVLSPQASSVGSAAAISRSLLTSSYAPVLISLPADNVTTSTNLEYVILVKGPVTAASASLKHLYLSSGAPTDLPAMQWSNNGGSSWLPASKDKNKQDVPFEIYGSYETSTTAPVTKTSYYLKSVALRLTAGSNPSAQLSTTVATPNLPVVAGP